MSERRVFVIQDDGNRDYSDARRFGVLVPLFERDAYPDDAEQRVEVMLKIVKSKMADFNCMTDSILLTGDPLAIAVVSGWALANEVVHFLKWDKENKRYFRVPVRV